MLEQGESVHLILWVEHGDFLHPNPLEEIRRPGDLDGVLPCDVVAGKPAQTRIRRPVMEMPKSQRVEWMQL